MGIRNFILTLAINLLLPSLILIHLFYAPFTKVEESFNLQATHDILVFGVPIKNTHTFLTETYDHFTFPGAVPRTFVGALFLANLSKPLIALTAWSHAQHVVRGVLGLLNALAMIRFSRALQRAYGKSVGRWYLLLQACQFHVVFYASRTLPNMFAFGLSTLALAEFVLYGSAVVPNRIVKLRLGISLLVLAGVIFRSEIAVLLAAQVLYILFLNGYLIREVVFAGATSAPLAILFSVAVDSYFWQKLIWPELSGFYFNAIQGKSAEWGTSPFHYYFTNSIPRLLLNPLILLLIPLSLCLPSTRGPAKNLIIPPFAFIIIYSLMPHKESRFIIYAVPPLTAAAALSASYLYTRRAKSILYRLSSLILLSSLLFSLFVSFIMLAVSSQNYPGGEALTNLQQLVTEDGSEVSVSVHMDVLSCMTGVTRFLQHPTTHPSNNTSGSVAVHWTYDKTEDEDTLLIPEFWEQFDYVLAEKPELVIGKWDIIGTVYGFSGVEFLRPGEGSTWLDNMAAAVDRANITDFEGNKISTHKPTLSPLNSIEPTHDTTASTTATGSELAATGQGTKDAGETLHHDIHGGIKYDIRGGFNYDSRTGGEGWIDTDGIVEEVAEKLDEVVNTIGYEMLYITFRDFMRATVTRGWWIGPKIEAKIRVLRKSSADDDV